MILNLKKLFRYTYIIIFIVMAISCSDKVTNPEKNPEKNTAPKAIFTISQITGSTETIFYFDASASYDNEDQTQNLEVRWDWENDGNWDSEFTTSKTASYKYTSEGTKEILLEVRDTGGLTSTTTKQVIVIDSVGQTGTVSDIDGNVYTTVQIGTQWWMVENLNVTHYNNGDDIPNITDTLTWSGLSTGAYCNYDNDTNNASIYGRLYNWFAVNDARKIAPSGWHIPTDVDWQTLIAYLGSAGVGDKLKNTSGWENNGNGNNSSGFSALPGGVRASYDGQFYSIGTYCAFWSSTEGNTDGAWHWHLSSDESSFSSYVTFKKAGLSVRCVKN